MLFFFFNFNEVSIYTQFFLKYNVSFSFFFFLNKDMMINLYKLYFQPNK